MKPRLGGRSFGENQIIPALESQGKRLVPAGVCKDPAMAFIQLTHDDATRAARW
jgi:hypothetical protein